MSGHWQAVIGGVTSAEARAVGSRKSRMTSVASVPSDGDGDGEGTWLSILMVCSGFGAGFTMRARRFGIC